MELLPGLRTLRRPADVKGAARHVQPHLLAFLPVALVLRPHGPRPSLHSRSCPCNRPQPTGPSLGAEKGVDETLAISDLNLLHHFLLLLLPWLHLSPPSSLLRSPHAGRRLALPRPHRSAHVHAGQVLPGLLLPPSLSHGRAYLSPRGGNLLCAILLLSTEDSCLDNQPSPELLINQSDA